MKLCKLYLSLASMWLDRPSALPCLIRRHVEHCPQCSEKLSRLADLEQQLTQVEIPDRTPPFLVNRILANLKANPAPSTAPQLRWATSIAFVAVTVLVLAVMLQRGPSSHSDSSHSADSSSSGPGQSLTPMLGLTQSATENLRTWSSAMETPLQSELTLAMQDGRRMLSAMVSSFVPRDTTERWLDQAGALMPGTSTPPKL